MPVCKQCEADGNLGRTCPHQGTWEIPGGPMVYSVGEEYVMHAPSGETFEILKAPDVTEPMNITVANGRPLHIRYIGTAEQIILKDLLAELKRLLRYDFVDGRLLSVEIQKAEARLKGLNDE